MGASEEISLAEQVVAKQLWLESMHSQIKYANRLLDLGVAKEITNRLLEPWMWVTGLVTSTEMSNYYKLRRTKWAQPEIKKLADMMYEVQSNSTPTLLKRGEWHVPMLNFAEEDLYKLEDKLKIATGRLARVSYLTHDGKRDIDKDIDLHNSLLTNFHMSPFEHCCKNMENNRQYGNFLGWKQYRKYIHDESGSDRLVIEK